MNSIRTRILNEKNFHFLLKELKELGVLGDLIVVGTSVDDTIPVKDIEYLNDGSDDSYVGINVSLESDYLVTTYPKGFKYKNVLVSIDTKLEVKWGDISKNLIKKPDFINEVKNIMKNAI
jgi:hypothetical protein